MQILVVLHGFPSRWCPRQDLPPAIGAGLSHCRSRDIAPVPHVTLHSVQLLHADQPPSTVWRKKQDVKIIQQWRVHSQKEDWMTGTRVNPQILAFLNQWDTLCMRKAWVRKMLSQFLNELAAAREQIQWGITFWWVRLPFGQTLRKRHCELEVSATREKVPRGTFQWSNSLTIKAP